LSRRIGTRALQHPPRPLPPLPPLIAHPCALPMPTRSSPHGPPRPLPRRTTTLPLSLALPPAQAQWRTARVRRKRMSDGRHGRGNSSPRLPLPLRCGKRR
jgi:hypothetical protein